MTPEGLKTSREPGVTTWEGAEPTPVLTPLGLHGCSRMDQARPPPQGPWLPGDSWGGQGPPPPKPTLAQGQGYRLPGPKPLGSAHGHSPERPLCTERPAMGLGGSCPPPPLPGALALPHRRRWLSSEAGAAALRMGFVREPPKPRSPESRENFPGFPKSEVLKRCASTDVRCAPVSHAGHRPPGCSSGRHGRRARPRPGHQGPPPTTLTVPTEHTARADGTPRTRGRRSCRRTGRTNWPPVQAGEGAWVPQTATSFSYGFGVEGLPASESRLCGRCPGSLPRQGQEQQLCSAAARTACPTRHPFQWPPRTLCPVSTGVRESCLTHQVGWHRPSAPTPA